MLFIPTNETSDVKVEVFDGTAYYVNGLLTDWFKKKKYKGIVSITQSSTEYKLTVTIIYCS